MAIDRYVRINVQGVEKLVDALGGLTIYVPKDMHYQDDSQHLYINLKAGKQHLSGTQVLQLLRFRYDNYGDIGRIQRQQMVMRALFEQAFNPTTLARSPQIIAVIQSHIDTNLSVEELLALAGFATGIDRSRVNMLMLPGDFSRPSEYDASYWLPDRDRIQTMVSQYFDLGTVTNSGVDPARLRVAIQNTTGADGITGELVRKLEQAGYGNTYLVDPMQESLKVTRIVAQQGDLASAEALRQQLGFGEVRIESTGSLQSDITIQIGRDCLQQLATP
ncbi:LCP family protein [Neosynechococcus sphagnicola]|uniref:LCP family protein n=1 Tax=Neosynechococcus sphagnicola TaxID=1501145 RepID=UPI000ACB4CC3|nr:LCP family protein [Neosynechococcus sphagnicola]